MVDAKVPGMWAAVAYPSLKPLQGWVLDLAARIEFLSSWIAEASDGDPVPPLPTLAACF